MAAMAVERWTPERRRELTRSALVDAAAQVFARRGFHGASLDEIADTAGFTRGAIYKNFADKEDLFLAVFDRHIERQLEAFSGEIDGVGAVAEVDVARLAGLWQDVVARDPSFHALNLEFYLYAIRNPEVRERFVAQQHKTNDTVARFIGEQAKAAGFRIKVPPMTLAKMVNAASEGFSLLAYLDREEGTNMFEFFLELLLTAVVEDPPARRRSSDSSTG
jgi:AcrR family transcriptional regulator